MGRPGGPAAPSASVWLVIYVLGAIAAPFVALVVGAFALAVVRSMRFKRRKGWQAEQVPHTVLYEFYHSCSVDMDAQKVLCCMAEKGVDFKDHEIDIGFFGRFQHLEEPMLLVNPNGTQPTLVHDGHPVVGIEDIIKYLEEHVAGPGLLPVNTEERQEVVRWIQALSHAPVPGLADDKGNPQWTLGMATHLLSVPVINEASKPATFFGSLWAVWRHPNPLPEFGRVPYSLLRHFREQASVPPSKASKLSFTVLARSFDTIEQSMAADEGRHEFLVGSGFSLADICLTANLNRLELLGILELLLGDDHPRLRGYWERMRKRPSFQRSFRPTPTYPGLKELETAFERFRQKVLSHGLAGAYRLDEDGEEEEY